MIKYVYASKNKLSGNFNMPVLQDFPKDNAAEAFAITAKEHPGDKNLSELEMYYLGTFDTKTGEFNQVIEYLIDLSTVMLNKVDGKQESVNA